MLLDLGDDALKVLLAVAIIWSSPFWAPLLVGIVCGVLPGLWLDFVKPRWCRRGRR